MVSEGITEDSLLTFSCCKGRKCSGSGDEAICIGIMPTDFTIPVACVTEFLTTGVAVIPAVLSAEEVLQARQAFHSFLLMEGVDTSRLEETAGALRGLSSTAGSGGVLDVFYESWQLALAENPRVFASLSQLWAASFARDNCDAYRHPYGSFNPCKGYLYLDRLCFRVPDHVSAMHSLTVGKKQRPLQRSLTPHLDCCPHDLYASSNRKWRPVQAFLALTDTLEKDQGGFEACLGMHLEFDEWVRRRAAGSSSGSSPPCVGQFTPIRPVEDADVMSRMQHVPCRAGDLVCWDFRTPHANSRFNRSENAREAVYIGLLPCTPLNRAYAEEQLRRLRAGLLPVDQWIESNDAAAATGCDVEYTFSQLGERLMASREW